MRPTPQDEHTRLLTILESGIFTDGVMLIEGSENEESREDKATNIPTFSLGSLLLFPTHVSIFICFHNEPYPGFGEMT